MLFYIFIALLIIIPIMCLWCAIKIGGEAIFVMFWLWLIGSLIPAVAVSESWTNHANDLGTIYAQDEVIKVFQSRIDRLEETLNTFSYPAKPTISLDADTPWASIVSSLSVAETQLAEAEKAKADAIVSIEKRRHGPFSGVISFVGDYK